MKAYLHYRDDGPDGPCGQTMSITAPRSKLYVYEGPTALSDASAYIMFLQERRNHAGRRNPRIEQHWIEEDGNVGEGPIVPAAERVA